MSICRIDVALIGIGGYGAYNLELVRQLQTAGRVRLAAVIDPMAERSPHWPGLLAEGVPSFPDLAEFKQAGVAADLAVISSPIAFHAEQSCDALAMGMNVLCEKPMAATIEDAYRMRASRDAAGRFLEIGYQWSFSRAIQGLKRVFFYTAHCVQEEVGPVFRFLFENATVEYEPRGHIRARFTDGHEEDYGNPDLDPVSKVMHCVDQCMPGTAVTVCGPEAALAHTLCVNGMQNIPIHDFDPKWIERLTYDGGETLTFVPGLNEAIRQGGEQGRLFSEMQLPWACLSGTRIGLEYQSFPAALQ